MKSPTPYTVQPMQENWHGYPEWKTINIRDARNCHVLTIGEVDRLTGEESEDTAAFIVEACNNYAALRADNAKLREALDVMVYTVDGLVPDKSRTVKDAIAIARRALEEANA